MRFTDEDLKRVLKEMEYKELELKLPALLARLELAEAVIVEADQNGFSDKAIELETAWRKVAGK